MGRCLAFASATATLLCLASPVGANAANGNGESAEQQLIETYTPRLMLREGDEICDTDGEQYEATTVNTVLGNPAVELTEADEDGDETTLKHGPRAADIAGLGEPHHLNIPGDPLGDTCDYARDFAKLKREGKAAAVTYAHIAREAGRPGLAIQYWFFWYFNQFNDLHEGDWEGMQVVFESSNPRRALEEEPSEIGRFCAVKLLAFSDLHRDLGQAAQLVEMSAQADAVIGAGDFASVHEGLEETIGALAAIEAPTVLVPGNNETETALREAASGWSAATVLHGSGTTIDGIEFYGLGAGIPITPWDWSFDLDDDSATQKLAACPQGAIMVLHSPPQDHCDSNGGGDHFGSGALLGAIEEKRPRLAVCGHIHESWGCESRIGETPVRNLGPKGTWLEI